MATYRCIRCGKEIENKTENKVATCSHCGTRQAFPLCNDEGMASQYDSASLLFNANEYDNAAGLYKHLAKVNPSDPIAHWMLVLCKYGIQYCKSDDSTEWKSTIKRFQTTRVQEDPDYKEAIRLADDSQKPLLKREAEELERMRLNIEKLYKKEIPVDVFISYKETDENGKRTYDSDFAKELYRELRKKGYEVFYAPITLKGKAGEFFEPYIYSAIHSAKAMVVIGTKPEYFKSAWIRNEWIRFLPIVNESNGRKLLIPVCRSIHPNDLPKELSRFEIIDMETDDDMFDSWTTRVARKINEVAGAASFLGNNKTLQRAYHEFLRNGEFQQAKERCDRALDEDYKNASAYVVMLMADLQVRSLEELANQNEPFDQNESYKKAMNYGNESLKRMLRGYVDNINKRNEYNRKLAIYNRAVNVMGNASTEKEYNDAADIFTEIEGFKDASQLLLECQGKANECKMHSEYNRKLAIYNKAVNAMNKASTEEEYNAAADLLASIEGFDNASQLLQECRKKANESKMNAIYANAIQKAQEKTAEAYQEAIAILETIRGWKDAEQRIQSFRQEIKNIIKNTYASAKKRMNKASSEKEYAELAQMFSSLGNYSESEYLTKCCNQMAENCRKDEIMMAGIHDMSIGDSAGYNSAIRQFKTLKGWKNANELISIGNRSNAYQRLIKILSIACICFAMVSITTTGLLWINGRSGKRVIDVADDSVVETIEHDQTGQEVVETNNHDESVVKENTTVQKSNGKELIEWIVLDKEEDGTLLLLSKYILDCKPYNETFEAVTWEDCTLRDWLNNEEEQDSFYNKAFSNEGRRMIQMSTAVNKDNEYYSTEGGNDTQDKVFLLSLEDARNEQFLKDAGSKRCQATTYAANKGTYINKDCNSSPWWLRSPGINSGHAALVNRDGGIDAVGLGVDFGFVGVRPALRVNP